MPQRHRHSTWVGDRVTHHLYVTPGIDVQKMREYAKQLTKTGESVLIHFHAYRQPCYAHGVGPLGKIAHEGYGYGPTNA